MIAPRRSTTRVLLTSFVLLAACGAQQATPTTPAPRELVVDEPTVVTAQRPLRPGELPPLPQALAQTSAAFQRGHALASALLQAASPGAPSALDDASYATWSAREFQAWLATRVRDAQAASDALGAVRDGPASEHVPAAALLGLVFARTHAQLLAVPAPASVVGDAKLLRIYGSQLNASAQTWSEQAAAAFGHCSRAAAQQRDPAFGSWLELCQRQLESLQREAQSAQLLADIVAAEREADRLAAEGPRPEGPQICWGPTASAITPAAAATTATTSAASAPPPSGPTPAAPSAADGQAPTAEAKATSRDLRYGPRDAATGVRVWAALADDPSMDASPLLASVTRASLASCFAKSVRPDRAVTVALHATLSVDLRGKARSARITPEPSDPAATPDAALTRCLERALQRVSFAPSPGGQPTQASATFCLRRD